MKYKEYIALADKYEVKSFIDDDPILFCYIYDNKKDIEIAGIISSWLTFGEHKMYMSKILYVLTEVMSNTPLEYIMSGKWSRYKDDYSCLYKALTWHNFAMLCDKLRTIYLNNKDLEDAVLKHYTDRNTKFRYYHQALCDLLSGESMIGSSTSMGINNRMNMFLRWMIRRDSQVDLGLWREFKPSNLIVPCDTKYLDIAKKLKIITKREETLKVAVRLTDYAKKVFDDDPCRMYFTLYGLSKDEHTKE